MTGVALALHQYRFDQKQFWREPASVFFTVILPLIFLVLFVAIFGNGTVELGEGRQIRGATYFVPSILTLALLNATFVNLTIWLSIARERGQLKRVRATPVPAWVVIAAAVSALLYGVELPGATLPALLLAVLVGVVALAGLGFAAAALVPSENAAPPVANAIVLPLEFISGVFIPSEAIPGWMDSIASVFPVKPLFDAILTAFDPSTTGAGIAWADLAVLAAWGVAGVLLALKFFRWSPRR